MVKFLASVRKTDIKDANDLSAVIRLEYRGYSVLFTGDLGEDGERELISEGGDLSADVLKVGHHGSRYSTSGEFLRAVDPDLAIISAGRITDMVIRTGRHWSVWMPVELM